MAKWPQTKCPHCKGIVDIQDSTYVQRLIVQLKTLREQHAIAIKNSRNVHSGKNGIIQSLHKKVGFMLGLMNEGQLKKFREINKSFRDEEKRWKKELLK